MRTWSTLSRLLPSRSLRDPSTGAPTQRLARIAAAVVIATYLAVTVAAYVSTLGPGSLAMRIGRCGDRPCVSWVMPGGWAWTQGARPEMTVLSADGRELVIGGAQHPLPVSPKREAQVVGDAGDILKLVVNESPISMAPLKFSLWLVGGAFALLGAAVIVRRPDLPAARWFALFSGFCAGALAVGPSSGGPAPPWATGVQALTFTGIGITFVPFVVELMGGVSSARAQRVIRAFVVFGLGIIIAFGGSVVFNDAYPVVRPVMLLYVAGSILSGTTIIVLRALRSGSPQDRQQARIAAWGSSLGWTPFVVLTLVPQAISNTSWLLPAHISILPLALMPVSFAYAIVQHQMMGVRRLVHRGMVYSISSLVLLGLVSLGLAIVPTIGTNGGTDLSSGFIQILVVVGVLLFFVLRWAARRLVDRFIYRETVDYPSLLQAVESPQSSSVGGGSVARELAERIGTVLNLESVLLFLGPDLDRSTLAAAIGGRSGEVLEHAAPQAPRLLLELRAAEIGEMRWESNELLLANLMNSGRYSGYVLLGPKAGGEVFIDDEKRVVTSIIPVLAMAIEKSGLAEDLRQLGQRLVHTEETERARVAYDLHDGPLQKAMLLAGDFALSETDHHSLAKQLADELREICAHLRPAILDDLGIVPALEWLVLDAGERHQVAASFHTTNLEDDARFRLDLELVLFRVAQEAITNVVKHAEAKHLRLTLSRDATAITLKVEDDGVGFPVSGLAKDGMGLPGMRDRLTQLDGMFDIRSERGIGTTITITIDLPPVEGALEVLDAPSLTNSSRR